MDGRYGLSAASASEFFATENATRSTFVKGLDGQVQDVIARSGNNQVHRRRVPYPSIFHYVVVQFRLTLPLGRITA
jgi:hypothetical protein